MEVHNYRIKEETTSSLVGGMEMWKGLAPHPRVADKNWEGYLRSKGSQPHTRPPSPGLQCKEEKSPQFLAVYMSRD